MPRLRSCFRPALRALLAAALVPLLAAAPSVAGEEAQLNLDQAIEQALNYSPNLSGAREDLEAAVSRRKETTTGFLPTLSTDYNYIKTQDLARIKTKFGYIYQGTLDTYQWTTSLSQPIFTGFKLSATYKLADLGVDFSELQVYLTRLDVAYSTKKAYFEYLRAQKSLEVADQQVVQLTSHLRTARDFFEVGILPMNDVLKVEVELADAKQLQVQADNAVSVTRAALNTLLGRPVGAALLVEDSLNHHEIKLTYEKASQAGRLERPELKALDVQMEQGRESVRQAQAGYYPQVNLQASYIFTGENWDFGDSGVYDPTSWQVVTQLNWPFWEWGRTLHQVNQKRANLRKIEATRRDLQDQVELQIKQSWLSLKDSEKNIGTSLTSIASAEENLRITQERFKEQLTTNTEVLDAQTLLTKARTNYYTALTQYNLAEAALLRSMGRGLPQGLDAKPARQVLGGSAPPGKSPEK